MHLMRNLLAIQPDSSRPVISRRDLARILFSAAVAGTLPSALPVNAFALSEPALPASPVFLSPAQIVALGILSDTIVPGSRQAQSAAFLDLLLSVDSTEEQQRFLAALSAFDAAARSAFQTQVSSLDPAQLNELLTSLSAPDSPGNGHFRLLKNWVVSAYYSSEPGMRELGWTPDRVFTEFPSCPHPDGHV